MRLTPVCRNFDDPTWSEPFLQAAQWALTNPHEILADARRVCHRDFCESLLETWPRVYEVPAMMLTIQKIGSLQVDVAWKEESEGLFEDSVQLLCAFGRIVCERAIQDRLLVSTEICYYDPTHE